MQYRLRAISFKLRKLDPGDISSELANAEPLTKPYVIVGAYYASPKPVTFDVDNFKYASMGIASRYEAIKKLSLIPSVDDIDGRTPNILVALAPHVSLIDFEINSPDMVLDGFSVTDCPVVHILEKI